MMVACTAAVVMGMERFMENQKNIPKYNINKTMCNLMVALKLNFRIYSRNQVK